MKNPANIIRADILNTPAYQVQNATGLIKLDAMENPYPLPAAAQTALGAHLAQVALNRYPAAGNQSLRTKLKAAFAIPAQFELVLGNGSDELIHLIIQACAKPGACVLAPTPGFVMYAMSAQFNQVPFVGVPLNATDFSLDMPAMLAAIARHQPAVIFLAYPNNPTGNCWPAEQIQQLIAAAPGLVVIDEAYQPFAQTSWLPRLSDAANVVIIRTLSKLGLAGIRLGYLIASPAWQQEIDKVRPPYNVNVLTQAAAEFILDHHLPALQQQAAILREQRTVLFAALSQMPGVTPFASQANFILVRVPDAAAWLAALKTHGLLVKNVAAMQPQLLANCLRLTIGTPAQTAQLIHALQAIIANQEATPS